LENMVLGVRNLLGIQKVELPDIERIKDLASKVQKATELLKRLVAVVIAIRDLRGVDQVDVPPLPSLGEKVEDLKSFNRWQTWLQDLESSLGQYEGFDAVADLDPSTLKQTRDRF